MSLTLEERKSSAEYKAQGAKDIIKINIRHRENLVFFTVTLT